MNMTDGIKKAKRLTKEEKIAKLAEKKAQIIAQINKLQAADKAKERKLDARRKILVGGFVLAQIEKDPIAKELVQKLIATLKREDDIALFKGL